MNRILLGKGEHPVHLHAQYGNRHGLVAGATGTGKSGSHDHQRARPNASRQDSRTAVAPSKVHEFLWGTKRRQGMVETMAKQAARTVGSQLGRQILRGVLGGILGSKRAR